MGVIFSNFLGFDMLILIAAVFNGFVYYIVKSTSDKLRSKMTHKIYVPHFNISRSETDKEVASLREEEVLEMRDKTNKFYSLFVNITAIFPLLGILGTVVSLLGMVQNMDNVTGNFYSALTSTFWGLIFAIVFKFLDGIISPQIENNEKSVLMYLQKYTDAENAPAPDADKKKEFGFDFGDIGSDRTDEFSFDTGDIRDSVGSDEAAFPEGNSAVTSLKKDKDEAIVVPDEEVSILTSPFSGGDDDI